MGSSALVTIIGILRDLAYAAAFLLAARASYLTLKQPRIRQWLNGIGTLGTGVVFVALSGLLYAAVAPIIGRLFAFPLGLVSSGWEAGLMTGVSCLGGVLMLIALARGRRLLVEARRPAPVRWHCTARRRPARRHSRYGMRSGVVRANVEDADGVGGIGVAVAERIDD